MAYKWIVIFWFLSNVSKIIYDLGDRQEVKEWRKELRHLLDEFHRDLEFRNDVTLNMEVLFNDKERLAGRMNNIENGFERLQLLSPTGVIDNRDTCKRCAVLEQKLAEAVLELRQMKNIVCESEDKCERLDRIVVENRKKCAQMKQEVSDINIHLLMEKKLRVITNFSGHLIWCIDRFAEKMVDAKENDVILKSPIFSNRQYGYNLRVGWSRAEVLGTEWNDEVYWGRVLSLI